MSDESLHTESRLTAFVLDELPPDERAAFERQLAEDDSLRAETHELRDLAALVFAALHTEPEPALDPTRRRAILNVAAGGSASTGPRIAAAPAVLPSRRSAAAGVAGLSALALLAMVLVFGVGNSPLPEMAHSE